MAQTAETGVSGLLAGCLRCGCSPPQHYHYWQLLLLNITTTGNFYSAYADGWPESQIMPTTPCVVSSNWPISTEQGWAAEIFLSLGRKSMKARKRSLSYEVHLGKSWITTLQNLSVKGPFKLLCVPRCMAKPKMGSLQSVSVEKASIAGLIATATWV